jgi:hypothetical protein
MLRVTSAANQVLPNCQAYYFACTKIKFNYSARMKLHEQNLALKAHLLAIQNELDLMRSYFTGPKFAGDNDYARTFEILERIKPLSSAIDYLTNEVGALPARQRKAILENVGALLTSQTSAGEIVAQMPDEYLVTVGSTTYHAGPLLAPALDCYKKYADIYGKDTVKISKNDIQFDPIELE